jgi:repressor LexA
MNIEAAIGKFRKFYSKQRRLPTYEEICHLFHFKSKNASFYLVNKLIDAGILEKDKKGKLSPKKLFHIPQLGIIHAGHPVAANSLSDNSIDLYQYILDLPGQIFSLIVKGDSMIEEGITDGDIVIVEKGREPRNGDVVAACLNNEWTVKYFKKNNFEVLLVPANPDYPIIHAKGKDSLFIGGVVISVIRKYH